MVGLLLSDYMLWRWASASVKGTSHIRNFQRLQDAYAVSALTNESIFAVVSDGAGSAKFGAFGAWLTCRFLTVRFREWSKTHSTLPTNDDLYNWIDELRDWIYSIARRRAVLPRQFAATLAAIVIFPDETLTIHIGDSAIVGRKGTEWSVLCWPDNGEFASSTYFITDEPQTRLNINRYEREHNAFALFTDGVGELALSYTELTAHTPFFSPMMNPIDLSSGVGRLSDLSTKLAQYLGGSSVCERTDDDKTLILISGE